MTKVPLSKFWLVARSLTGPSCLISPRSRFRKKKNARSSLVHRTVSASLEGRRLLPIRRPCSWGLHPHPPWRRLAGRQLLPIRRGAALQVASTCSHLPSAQRATPWSECANEMESSKGRLLSAQPARKLNLSWIPKGMDSSSAFRVEIKVPKYVELPCEEYHVTEVFRWVVDKDTINWVDFSAELDAKIKHGTKQELQVSFLDKSRNEYVGIASDSAQLNAFSQYWDIRKLQLQVIVHDNVEPDNAVVPSTQPNPVVILDNALLLAPDPKSAATHDHDLVLPCQLHMTML